MREMGIDPEQVQVLGVEHESFGRRLMLLPDNLVSEGAIHFAEWAEEESSPQDRVDLARSIILGFASQFAASNPLFLFVGENDENCDLVYSAAALLLDNEITHVHQHASEEKKLDYYFGIGPLSEGLQPDSGAIN